MQQAENGTFPLPAFFDLFIGIHPVEVVPEFQYIHSLIKDISKRV